MAGQANKSCFSELDTAKEASIFWTGGLACLAYVMTLNFRGFGLEGDIEPQTLNPSKAGFHSEPFSHRKHEVPKLWTKKLASCRAELPQERVINIPM